MPPLRSWISQCWGQLLFYGTFVSAMVTVSFNALRGKSSVDFDVFRESAAHLLRGENPYGISYPLGQQFLPGEFPGAQYLYSPAAGIFFFGPFTRLPYVAALFLYNCVLFAAFGAAVGALERFDREISPRCRNLFFLFLTFEALGSLLNGKIELLIASLFICVYLSALKGGPSVWVAALLGIFSNFKLQPLAASGLLVSATERTRRWAKAAGGYFFAMLVALAAPALFLGEKTLAFHRAWLGESGAFVARTFGFRAHIWNFLSSAFGWKVSLGEAGFLGAVVGVLLFLYCVYLRCRRRESTGERVLRALALGGAFSVIFSPAAQSSAYILLTPLYWAYCKLPKQFDRSDGRAWGAGFAVSLFFISLCYSDLVGPLVREQARAGAWKALGGALLLGFYLYFDVRYDVSTEGK